MQKPKSPTPSPLKIIESKPFRKTRSEVLLRLLIASSYPHSLLSNITVEMAKGYGVNSANDLNDLARNLRSQETELSLTDFIRCIELQRTSAVQVCLTAKRLNQLEGIKALLDNVKNHEVVHNVEIAVEPDEVVKLQHATKIADILLNAYHRSQVQRHNKTTNIKTDVVWKLKQRKLALGENNHSLNDLKYEGTITVVPYDVIVQELVNELQHPNFHILMTQNNIILRAGDMRIMVETEEGK